MSLGFGLGLMGDSGGGAGGGGGGVTGLVITLSNAGTAGLHDLGITVNDTGDDILPSLTTAGNNLTSLDDLSAGQFGSSTFGHVGWALGAGWDDDGSFGSASPAGDSPLVVYVKFTAETVINKIKTRSYANSSNWIDTISVVDQDGNTLTPTNSPAKARNIIWEFT